jgi:2-dehydropantoate 2-reductase
MRIAVYGAGGAGGRLAHAGADVHFIARGAQLQALRRHGLNVRSVNGDFRVQAPVTDDPADVGRSDFVLFYVKAFDTDAAAARLGPWSVTARPWCRCRTGSRTRRSSPGWSATTT